MTQYEKLEKIQNEAMRIILRYTKDTEIKAMRYLLDFPSIVHRAELNRTKAYLRISRDNEHPLHAAIKTEKGNRLKIGKSWLGRAEDTVSRVCPPTEIVPGEEWVRTASVGNSSINVVITLRKANKNNVGSMINSEI